MHQITLAASQNVLMNHIIQINTRMWANANVMAAMPNTDGALCSTPQSLADAHYQSAMQ